MSKAMHVVSMRDFEENAFDAWERASKLASVDMAEPLQTGSHLAFCRHVDPYGMPMDSCSRADAVFAVCTVTVKDLGSPPPNVKDADADWEPLCEGAFQ